MGKIVGRFLEERLSYQARQGRKIPIEEITSAIGISRQTLHDIESGKSIPRSTTLARFCELYGVTPGKLLVYVEGEGV